MITLTEEQRHTLCFALEIAKARFDENSRFCNIGGHRGLAEQFDSQSCETGALHRVLINAETISYVEGKDA